MAEQLIGKFYSLKLPYTWRFATFTKGWYLLVTKKGQTYLVEKHFSLGSYQPLNIYETDISMREYILEPQKLELAEKKRSKSSNMGLYLLLLTTARLLVKLIPMNWLFGSSNIPFNMFVGLMNVSVTLVALLGVCYLVRQYRLWQLRHFLTRQGKVLTLTGKIFLSQYDKYLRFGPMSKKLILFQVIALLPICSIFVGVNLFVSYRLFFFLVASILVGLLYRGVPVVSPYMRETCVYLSRRE